MEPFILIGLPAALVIVVALAGSTRRLGFWATLVLSILLTPLGGFIIALISGPRQRKPKPKPKREPETE